MGIYNLYKMIYGYRSRAIGDRMILSECTNTNMIVMEIMKVRCAMRRT